MSTLRRARTVMIRPTYDYNHHFRHHDRCRSKHREISPSSSDTSLTTFSDQTTAVQSYIPPSRKLRSKTSVIPYYSHQQTRTPKINSKPAYSEDQLGDLDRIKQYVRDLQIEISTLRHHHLQLQPTNKFCEDCQYHRKRHATAKQAAQQLKQQNAELNTALEEANKVITDLQEENVALSQATKTLKKKAEKLLRLVQKRDALRDHSRLDVTAVQNCKHRRCKVANVDQDMKERREPEADIVSRKWERFRKQMSQVKGQDDDAEYEPEQVHRQKVPEAPETFVRMEPGSRMQQPRTADPIMMAQFKSRQKNVPQGSTGRNADKLRHTESERTFSENPQYRPPQFPVANPQDNASKKKVMSATELDKWSRHYAKKQIGDQKRQERKVAYLANYDIPQRRALERQMSAEERLERFRSGQTRSGEEQQGQVVNNIGYNGVNENDFRLQQHLISMQNDIGAERDSQNGATLDTICESNGNNSDSSGGGDGEAQSETQDQFEDKEDLDCVNQPLQEIICQIENIVDHQ